MDKLPPTPTDEDVEKLMKIFVKSSKGKYRRCRSDIKNVKVSEKKREDNALAYAQQTTLKALARDGVACCKGEDLEDGYNEYSPRQDGDDGVTLDSQAYWKAMWSDAPSTSISDGKDTSWCKVDSILRETFRGIDIAELYRGEPAGEDDVYTNNVLWQSSGEQSNEKVGGFKEMVYGDEEARHLSDRFTDTTARYGIWEDSEVEESFHQQSPLTPILCGKDEYAVPPNFRGRRIEDVEISARNSTPPRLSVEEPYLCRCAGEMRKWSGDDRRGGRNQSSRAYLEWCDRERCAPPRIRCLKGNACPYCYVEVWEITREFRGDKQLPPENYLEPPKVEIGTLEDIQEKLLEVLVDNRLEKDLIEKIPIMWGAWKESVIFALPTMESYNLLVKALARCGYGGDKVVRVDLSRSQPIDEDNQMEGWPDQEGEYSRSWGKQKKKDPREKKTTNRRVEESNQGGGKRSRERTAMLSCLLCKEHHRNEFCPYFRQSVVLRSASEVFNSAKWGNQRWLDSVLSKGGYTSTLRVIWLDEFGESKAAMVVCLNHSDAEKMRNVHKLDLGNDVFVDVEEVPTCKDDPRWHSRKRQKQNVSAT